MAVVPNGIPLPKPSAEPRDKATTRFLFAARLTPEKGCQVVLDAVKHMPSGLNFELNLAGKGAFEEEFRKAAAMDSRIKFLGFIKGDEKTKAFNKADCLLLPSLWYENAPVIITEAAAYGIGVIGSNIGAIPEFIHDGKTGLLFEPGSGLALAEAMQRVIKDEGLRSRFANESRKSAESHTVAKMVDAYTEQYQHALAIF